MGVTMPDWNKVAGTRAENARKAMELLENTAGKGYEFTPEEGLSMIQGLEDALNSLKAAYKDRLPENGFVVDSRFVAAAEPESVATPPAAAHKSVSSMGSQDPGVIAISNSRSEATNAPFDTNTRSDDRLTLPMWAQIKQFVEIIPQNQLPAYILHIGDRMYEDAYVLANTSSKAYEMASRSDNLQSRTQKGQK